MQVLLDWITVEENYSDWREGKVDGKTTAKSKLSIATEISALILQKGKSLNSKLV